MAPCRRVHEAGIMPAAEQFLMRLTPDQAYRRTNWTLTIDRRLDVSTELYDVWGKDRRLLRPEEVGERVHLRVEVQHLVRLPVSGAIMFLIRTYMLPMEQLVLVPAWAERTRAVLDELPEDMADYKGIIRYRDMVVDWLDAALAAGGRRLIIPRPDEPPRFGARTRSSRAGAVVVPSHRGRCAHHHGADRAAHAGAVAECTRQPPRCALAGYGMHTPRWRQSEFPTLTPTLARDRHERRDPNSARCHDIDEQRVLLLGIDRADDRDPCRLPRLRVGRLSVEERPRGVDEEPPHARRRHSTFFFVGWFLYNSMPTGVPRLTDAAKGAVPWSANMGPNIQDSASGIFWGAFALFAATTASILSGAVLERIRTSAFLVLAAVVGSVVWIIGAAWGWHPAGWMLTELGFHDVGAAGCVHLIAGAFTLGVLINLGPRIGRFNADGSANTIRPHNLPMTMLGLMLIFIGFFGFLMGCVIYTADGYTTIYGTRDDAVGVRVQHAHGPLRRHHRAYVASRGEPFWTISGGLAGIITIAAGMDLYHPALAFVLAIVGGLMIPYLGKLIERFGIDDVVGAVTVHGGCGALSLIFSGIFLAGYPNMEGLRT